MEFIQETLGEIRLNLKYIAFDLEATKRERDAYKERLGL